MFPGESCIISVIWHTFPGLELYYRDAAQTLLATGEVRVDTTKRSWPDQCVKRSRRLGRPWLRIGMVSRAVNARAGDSTTTMPFCVGVRPIFPTVSSVPREYICSSCRNVLEVAFVKSDTSYGRGARRRGYPASSDPTRSQGTAEVALFRSKHVPRTGRLN